MKSYTLRPDTFTLWLLQFFSFRYDALKLDRVSAETKLVKLKDECNQLEQCAGGQASQEGEVMRMEDRCSELRTLDAEAMKLQRYYSKILDLCRKHPAKNLKLVNAAEQYLETLKVRVERIAKEIKEAEHSEHVTNYYLPKMKAACEDRQSINRDLLGRLTNQLVDKEMEAMGEAKRGDHKQQLVMEEATRYRERQLRLKAKSRGALDFVSRMRANAQKNLAIKWQRRIDRIKAATGVSDVDEVFKMYSKQVRRHAISYLSKKLYN